MDTPPVQYVRTSDGYDIAYTVSGAGRPLVFAPLLANHVRHSWHFYGAWYQELAARFRFVAYDARGEGLSSRGLSPRHRMSDWQIDLEAVIDAANVDRPVIMAGCHSGHVAIRFAAEHPERVSALILNTVSIDMHSWVETFWSNLPAQNWEFFLDTLLPRGVQRAEASQLKQELREMFTADEMTAASRVMIHSSVQTDLPRLHTPTLVIHPQRYNLLPVKEGAALAAAIAGARFAIIDGDYVFGDARSGIAAIEDFLEDLRPTHEARAGLSALSPRELEVLRLLAAGKTNPHIAEALVISSSTVAKHVTSILTKTGAANRVEAALYAREHGLV